jgi:hypothetical protein
VSDDWLSHIRREVAAISEGFCPTCSGRLVPIDGAEGTTGLCTDHGTWRAWSDRERQRDRHDTWVSWQSLETAR